MAIHIFESNFPKLITISARHVGKYEECDAVWQKISAFSQEKNIMNQDTIVLGLCYDDPQTVKECRYDACVSLPNGLDPKVIDLPEGIIIKILEEKKCIMAIHKGAYKDMFGFYTELYGDEVAKKYTIDLEKPAIEIYLNCAKSTSPENLLTQVFIPIK
ncbi:MAG: AraC family transcriptional regulator [Candidatus Deianiraeaceae bacterium]|jgi:AraC family transcriptional regulator